MENQEYYGKMPVEIVFRINQALPTLNDYINQERENKFAAAKLKEKFTTICAWEAKSQYRGVILTNLYDIEIQWVNNGRHDHDNIAFAIKFILDGLKKAKIIKDDNPKHINDIHHVFLTDPQIKNTYCIVTLTKVE